MIGAPARLYPVYSVPKMMRELLSTVGHYAHCNIKPVNVNGANMMLLYTEQKYLLEFVDCIKELDSIFGS